MCLDKPAWLLMDTTNFKQMTLGTWWSPALIASSLLSSCWILLNGEEVPWNALSNRILQEEAVVMWRVKTTTTRARARTTTSRVKTEWTLCQKSARHEHITMDQGQCQVHNGCFLPSFHCHCSPWPLVRERWHPTWPRVRPNSHRTRDAHANWNVFPLLLLACSVNTPIDDNRSHLLRVASCVLCELGLSRAGPGIIIIVVAGPQLEPLIKPPPDPSLTWSRARPSRLRSVFGLSPRQTRSMFHVPMMNCRSMTRSPSSDRALGGSSSRVIENGDVSPTSYTSSRRTSLTYLHRQNSINSSPVSPKTNNFPLAVLFCLSCLSIWFQLSLLCVSMLSFLCCALFESWFLS